ncbi:proteasome subunit beta [Gordonia sp. HY002]|uniref:proteasome subunit beta n=1 Tax=Gordonia zhenghanii TaxID=2911516 RepID=UPI001EF002B5|nr:proteasome subunit beta [Gordonia zhenghanii]MCF8569856.1 proteasome subunit beta [Gordonia zhenghanii]MCF8602460.1 proteasome subunit beta [Gordonia zhenghanii]
MIAGVGGQSGHDISSFTEYLRVNAPDRLPGASAGTSVPADAAQSIPHGTTIVAVSYLGGVILAGDRRSTMGNLIATRDVQKVYITDEYSAAGIAGTAGIAIEMVRLFAVELEHYEKIEGVRLTLDGKASRLASMVRGNLGAAMQGLAAIPLLVGYQPTDTETEPSYGRIFSFDVAGSRHEELGGYEAIGSGSVFARSSLKKLYRSDMTADDALAVAVEALYDAADDDSATGGPDLVRRIFPTAVRIDADGADDVAETSIADAAQAVVDRRRSAHEDGGDRR